MAKIPLPVQVGDDPIDTSVTIGLNRTKKVEKIVAYTLDVNGDGTHILALSEAFRNEPLTLVVGPEGSVGTYRVTYDAITPKFTLNVVGDTVNARGVVLLFVIAYDQP